MTIDHDCSCGSCTRADLQADAFLALRARQGMLLGEDDFHVLMGNPRGKSMLHNAWLHGSGVVHGFGVRGIGQHVEVAPGLALDGRGRELLSPTTVRLDVVDWVRDTRPSPPADWDGCSPYRQTICVVAEFDCTTADPRPTLADPCDVSRGHDADSRVLEQARVGLAAGPCRDCHGRRDRRLRALFGLSSGGPRDKAAREARRALEDVARRPPEDRVEAFCRRMHHLAVHDVEDLRAPCAEGTDTPDLLPATEEDAPVVLACVVVEVSGTGDCRTVTVLEVDDCCRCVLMPTHTLSDLLCALAARVLRPRPHRHRDVEDCDCDECAEERDDRAARRAGRPEGEDRADDRDDDRDDDPDEGPRVHADDVCWDDDEGGYLVPVSAHLVPGSVRGAVRVTSLSGRGWVEEHVESVRYDPETMRIVVRMVEQPVNPIVRLTVLGTGSTPVFGAAPAAPLAGLHGGPRATRHDGRDAVVTVTEGSRESS